MGKLQNYCPNITHEAEQLNCVIEGKIFDVHARFKKKEYQTHDRY